MLLIESSKSVSSSWAGSGSGVDIGIRGSEGSEVGGVAMRR